MFHAAKKPPTHETIEQLWNLLIQEEGFSERFRDQCGMRLSIQKDSVFGPIFLSNDSCTHILEVSFPKLNCFDAFAEMYCVTWDMVRRHLARLDLEVYYGSSIDDCAPTLSSVNAISESDAFHGGQHIDVNDVTTVYWRPKESDRGGVRLKKFLQRTELSSTLFCRCFPACFAATHVNIEVDAQEVINKLPSLYAAELQVPGRFSQCRKFRGFKGQCVRLLAWLENFSKPYPMIGIPDALPRSMDEYRWLCSQCDGRDFSFVSIRDARRVEFRSACSQPTVEDVLELIRFRWESYQSAVDQPSLDLDSIRAEFVEACRTGRRSLIGK